jgi:hypothetical protein
MLKSEAEKSMINSHFCKLFQIQNLAKYRLYNRQKNLTSIGYCLDTVDNINQLVNTHERKPNG